MTKFKVRSGSLNKTIRAVNHSQAALKGVKGHKRPLGQVVMVVEKGKDELSHAKYYMLESVLEKLNFKIVKE